MDIHRTTVKRERSLSSSSSESSVASDSRSVSYSPPPKYHRASNSPSKRGSSTFICTLPPTCSKPDSASSYFTHEDLERHQDAFHKWICQTPIRAKSVPKGESTKAMVECGKVFPEERLLTLHFTETHDPVARQKQENGEKIFCCFLPLDQCKKRFISPNRRRHHLIDKHHYPRDYFFSITNHGINQLADKEGLAMSLIRPRRQYKPRARSMAWKEKRGKEKKAGMELDGPALNETAESVTHAFTQDPPDASVQVPAVSSPPSSGPIDVDMEGLATQLGNLDSSLQFTPRGVRKKAAAAAKLKE